MDHISEQSHISMHIGVDITLLACNRLVVDYSMLSHLLTHSMIKNAYEDKAKKTIRIPQM